MNKATRMLLFFVTITTVAAHGANEQDYEKAKYRDNQNKNSLNFIGADLCYLNDENSNNHLIDAILQHTDLTNAYVSNTILRGANLQNSTCYKTKFHYSDLTKTDFSYADIMKSEFNGAKIKSANFSWAKLVECDFSSTEKGFWNNLIKVFYTPYYKNRANINFYKAKIIKTNFTKTVLTEANFSKSYLTGSKFNYAILSFANFSNVKSLQNTDFRGAILYKANFKDTNLKGAIVNNVDFGNVQNLSLKQKKYLYKHGALNVYMKEEIEKLGLNNHDDQIYYTDEGKIDDNCLTRFLSKILPIPRV